MPFPVTDLDDADAILLVGANPAETMPPFMQHIRGGLIVVDPRRTATAERADAAFAARAGHGSGFGTRNSAFSCRRGGISTSSTSPPGPRVSTKCGGPSRPGGRKRAERVTGSRGNRSTRPSRGCCRHARNAYVLTARGTEQHASGTDTVSAWINLALALGLPGVLAADSAVSPDKATAKAAVSTARKPDQLPGYRKIDDPAARAHVAEVWGVEPDSIPGPGRSAYELFDALGQPGWTAWAARVRQQSGGFRTQGRARRRSARLAGLAGSGRLRAVRDDEVGGRRAAGDRNGPRKKAR